MIGDSTFIPVSSCQAASVTLNVTLKNMWKMSVTLSVTFWMGVILNFNLQFLFIVWRRSEYIWTIKEMDHEHSQKCILCWNDTAQKYSWESTWSIACAKSMEKLLNMEGFSSLNPLTIILFSDLRLPTWIRTWAASSPSQRVWAFSKYQSFERYFIIEFPISI
jgi:hypothetical protein